MCLYEYRMYHGSGTGNCCLWPSPQQIHPAPLPCSCVPGAWVRQKRRESRSCSLSKEQTGRRRNSAGSPQWLLQVWRAARSSELCTGIKVLRNPTRSRAEQRPHHAGTCATLTQDVSETETTPLNNNKNLQNNSSKTYTEGFQNIINWPESSWQLF